MHLCTKDKFWFTISFLSYFLWEVMYFKLHVLNIMQFWLRALGFIIVTLILSQMQAIVALKKGAHLLKYGRRGKPKFCPFRLSMVNLHAIYLWDSTVQKLVVHRMVSTRKFYSGWLDEFIPSKSLSLMHLLKVPWASGWSFKRHKENFADLKIYTSLHLFVPQCYCICSSATDYVLTSREREKKRDMVSFDFRPSSLI